MTILIKYIFIRRYKQILICLIINDEDHSI